MTFWVFFRPAACEFVLFQYPVPEDGADKTGLKFHWLFVIHFFRKDGLSKRGSCGDEPDWSFSTTDRVSVRSMAFLSRLIPAQV